jgi:capsular polysaccharide biosynthesis protein
MEQKYSSDEIEIDLADLLLQYLEHWFKIFLSACLVAGMMFAYCKLIAVPQYSSTAKLYALNKTDTVTSMSDIQTGTNLSKDYEAVVSSRPVVTKVIENLGLNMSYEEMCGKLKVSNQEDTRIINLTITDSDPEQAKVIVDEFATVVSAFIAEKMDQAAPSIIEEGYVSYKKVSPSTLKNTVLGGMIGGMLAVGVITITYLMNDTVANSDDIEKYLGLNTLASIPYEEEEDRKDISKKGVRQSKRRKKSKNHGKKR